MLTHSLTVPIYVLSSFVYFADMFLLFFYLSHLFLLLNESLFWPPSNRNTSIQARIAFIINTHWRKLSHKGIQRNKMCVDDEGFEHQNRKRQWKTLVEDRDFCCISHHSQFLFVLALLVFPNIVVSVHCSTTRMRF